MDTLNQPKQESTINYENLEHFKNLVDVWWKGNQLKALRRMNQVRVPFIQDCLTKSGVCNAETDHTLAGLNILDVGCGGGFLTEAIAELGATITGLDAAEELIKCAEIHASGNEKAVNKIRYICDTIENFSKANKGEYDVLLCSEVVEHVENVDLFLKCCIDLLKPNGSLILTTVNKTTRSWLEIIILCEYILGVIPKGTHEWQKFVTPENLQETLSKYNCSKFRTTGASYNYYYENWSFSSSTSAIYFLHAVKQQ